MEISKLLKELKKGKILLPTAKMKGVIAPDEGWEEHSWYLCLGAFSTHNPIHEIMLCVGFVDIHGYPAGYTNVLSTIGGDSHNLSDVYYLQPIKKLYTQGELTGGEND